MIEVVFYERDRNGNKTDNKVRIKSSNGQWIVQRFERELLKGVRKSNRTKLCEKLYGSNAD